MFGVREVSPGIVKITPKLPKKWPEMRMKNTRVGGRRADIAVKRAADWLWVDLDFDEEPAFVMEIELPAHVKRIKHGDRVTRGNRAIIDPAKENAVIGLLV